MIESFGWRVCERESAKRLKDESLRGLFKGHIKTRTHTHARIHMHIHTFTHSHIHTFTHTHITGVAPNREGRVSLFASKLTNPFEGLPLSFPTSLHSLFSRFILFLFIGLCLRAPYASMKAVMHSVRVCVCVCVCVLHMSMSVFCICVYVSLMFTPQCAPIER